jgi:2-amino-4-hydroxy-6-hydroxymethyldihydropteridine diphosphokinase
LIAIGANLPDRFGLKPLQICTRAVQKIGEIAGMSGLVRSRWYSSAALPDSSQPRYINGVVRVETGLPPPALLEALQEIEQSMGRVRSLPNAPRTLDLDVIDMDGMIRAANDPILPHPRAHLRAFVLLPLRDVAPGWVHPVLCKTVHGLIEELTPQDTLAV